MGAVTVAVEGPLDVEIARLILATAGHELVVPYVLRGKAALDARLPDYNEAARRARWLVLRDLDQDAPSACHLVTALLPRRAPLMRFRVAVHEAEAWLLGDRKSIADFLAVPESRIPLDADSVLDSKQELVNIARHSRNRDIREGIVPERSLRLVGPGYQTLMTQFVLEQWSPRRASRHSDSLRRCLRAVERW
jgi:hypothetical protein